MPLPETVHATETETRGIGPAALELEGVGVRYTLVTERSRTLKGRFIAAFSRNGIPEAQFWALRGIDLSVRSGEVLGILGPNGSGKSTMLRVLSRIIEPAEGRVTIRGRVTPILDLTSTLNPEFSGRENAYVLGALRGVSRKEVSERIPEIIEFSELGPFFEVPLKAYSSGMVARLAFALSTQLEPEILLLDEVLAVGDEQFQRKSYFRIRKLIDRGKIVLIVSHNTALLEQLCTRMIVLFGGTIVADGEPPRMIAEYRRRIG